MRGQNFEKKKKIQQNRQKKEQNFNLRMIVIRVRNYSTWLILWTSPQPLFDSPFQDPYDPICSFGCKTSETSFSDVTVSAKKLLWLCLEKRLNVKKANKYQNVGIF